MFDWNDQGQVGETIWGEFNESEDHIVPCTKDTEEHPRSSFEDCSKKQKNNDIIARTTRLSCGSKNASPDCDLGNRSSLNANEDHSGLTLDIDPWPDLPTLNTELSTGELSSLNKFSPLACSTVQLEGESEFFSNAGEEKDNDSFLDCDWSNFGGFDDLDKIFRNETTFGHDMATNVDAFLTSSADMIDTTVQPIPMPDEPFSRDEPFDQGRSSSQLVEHSGEKRKAGDKAADTVETREQAFCQTTHINQLTEKDDRKKKMLKSRKKAEERSKKKASQIINGPWAQNISHNQPFIGQNVPPFVMAPSQAILSPAIGQQRKVSDSEHLENLVPSAQFMYPQYGYPVYPFPGIPLLQHVQADMSGNCDGHVGHNPYHDSRKYPNSSSVTPAAQSKALTMTPQEKIEKLRRRQQAHAMLAIQQQQQQFGHQISGAENIGPQGNKVQDASNNNIGVEEPEDKLPPSAQTLLCGHNGFHRNSTLSGDNLSEKTPGYQLQEENIEKLRRSQQARAMLAIQQQQQQFGYQIIGAENVAPQGKKFLDASNNNIGADKPGNKLPPSAQNLLLGHDGSQRISTLSDDNSLEKTVYSQLQEALRKLDIGVRLCIRDSLFRLASSSTERQSAGDGSSTNNITKDESDVPVNEEPINGKRPMRLPDAETYTNPIDRTVAHLLFHRPLESSTRQANDEMPQSPPLDNPASKVNVHGSMTEREPEGLGEMELQPSD